MAETELEDSVRSRSLGGMDSMSWLNVHGHDDVVGWFRAAITRDKLASTFLFVGPPGIGKRTFAMQLARTLLCDRSPARRMAPCGECSSCVQITSGTHPDLLWVSKPADRATIPLELLIGPDNHRMSKGLCHDIGLKPFQSSRRVAIIDDADYLNVEGANALLKTLEEPPRRSVIILISSSAESQLPTIRSRSQIIRFQPPPSTVVADLLLEQGIVSDRAEAERLAGNSDGSLARAVELNDAELWTMRSRLLIELAKSRLASVPLASTLMEFVSEAGAAAPPRRARARQVIGFAIEFYRQALRTQCGCELASRDEETCRGVQGYVQSAGADAELTIARIGRCLTALEHIERFVNQGTYIECWLDDLSRTTAEAVERWG